MKPADDMRKYHRTHHLDIWVPESKSRPSPPSMRIVQCGTSVVFLSAFGVTGAGYTFAPPTEGRAHFPSPPTKGNSVVFLTRGAAASQGYFFKSPSAGHSRFPPSQTQGLSHCTPRHRLKGIFIHPPCSSRGFAPFGEAECNSVKSEWQRS